jgi:hypothetical protein
MPRPAPEDSEAARAQLTELEGTGEQGVAAGYPDISEHQATLSAASTELWISHRASNRA